MLEDAAGIRRVVLACGTVDLRKGIDGLAMIIGDQYGQNPFEKGTLANSHFLRPAGPHFPASQGHIKRPVLEIGRAERVPPC